MSSEYKNKTNYAEMRLDKLSLIIYLKEQKIVGPDHCLSIDWIRIVTPILNVGKLESARLF